MKKQIDYLRKFNLTEESIKEFQKDGWHLINVCTIAETDYHGQSINKLSMTREYHFVLYED